MLTQTLPSALQRPDTADQQTRAQHQAGHPRLNAGASRCRHRASIWILRCEPMRGATNWLTVWGRWIDGRPARSRHQAPARATGRDSRRDLLRVSGLTIDQRLLWRPQEWHLRSSAVWRRECAGSRWCDASAGSRLARGRQRRRGVGGIHVLPRSAQSAPSLQPWAWWLNKSGGPPLLTRRASVGWFAKRSSTRGPWFGGLS